MSDDILRPIDPNYATGDLASNIQAILRVAILAADNETSNVDPEKKIAVLERTVVSVRRDRYGRCCQGSRSSILLIL